MHSILDDGTWLRVENTYREMNAAEITILSYKRGVVSAETKLVDVDVSLLNTESLKTYCEHRGIKRGSLEQRLETIGLAKRDKGKCRPTKAAVLLFANSPSDLLALSGGRAGVSLCRHHDRALREPQPPQAAQEPHRASLRPHRTGHAASFADAMKSAIMII